MGIVGRISLHKSLTLALSVFILGTGIHTADAGYRRYQPSLDESQWNFSGNHLQCQLSQQLPLYGKAVFESHAGKSNMKFTLNVDRNKPLEFSNANIDIQIPIWRPGLKPKSEGQVDVIPSSSPIALNHDKAWRLLSELEKGFDPAFRYQDWIDKKDTVVVALSSARFNKTYQNFIQCVGELLPFEFRDIESTTLNFNFNSAKFTQLSQNKLLRVKQYLEADKDIELILIAGHTDSRGTKAYNLNLGRKRAESVKDYLVSAGIDIKRIIMRSYGEGRPIASNTNPVGRAKNRRVFIRLVK